MASYSRQWRPLFEDFLTHMRIDSKEVAAVDDRGSPLKMWGSQKTVVDNVFTGLDNDQRIFYILKNRQAGVSTISLAIDIFWLAMHPGMMGALVCDNEDNRNVFRAILTRYIDNLPPELVGDDFRCVTNNKSYLQFEPNGQRLDFLVAGKTKATWGESRGYSFAHLCMAKGTQVVTEHGVIKNVEDIRIGDRVLTHTGKPANVIDVFGQSGSGKPMVRVKPWLGDEIRYTTWHKIPTQRGLVQAGELRKDDLLVMPIRPIRKFVAAVTLPETGMRNGRHYVDAVGRFVKRGTIGATLRERDPWVTVASDGSGKTAELNEELGFAVGYYLAEGHINMDRLGRPCGITFARHRDETAYSDRAVAALSPYMTSPRTYHSKASLTTQVTINGSAFSRWLASTFGRTSGKRIPDDVFNWGADFCKGLLCGLLSGDGSKTTGAKQSNLLVMPTIRSSLAMQARDIAASLGYGWAGIKFHPARNLYGRECKEAWRVSWSGSAAASLRKLLGLPEIKRAGHDYTNKYVAESDRVLIKIKSIEPCGEEDEVWDISVDHADHTFRTPSMSTSNTEVANYGNPAGLASFRETLAETHPDRLFIYESTAKGPNHWKEMWDEAERDTEKRPIFVSWWHKEINRIRKSDRRFSSYGLNAPDQREREKIDEVFNRYKHVIDREQLAWIRWRNSDASVAEQDKQQNQPWLPEEAFVLTGFSFFQTRLISQDLNAVTDPDNRELYAFKGYKYWIENDFFAIKMEQITDPARIEEVELRVWEEPVKDAQYVIGCDPAFGRTDWKDRHAISVWRCYADRLVQVAEYATAEVESHQCAWVLAHLAGAYKNCIINLELTGGPGRAVMREWENLRNQMRTEMYAPKVAELKWDDPLQQARWYLYRRPDSMGAGYCYNFNSSRDTKYDMMNRIRSAYTQRLVWVRSRKLLEEMLVVVQEGSHIGAQGREKDDRVFGMSLANYAWDEWVRQPMIANGLSYEIVTKKEQGELSVVDQVVDRLVFDYFKKAEAQAADPYQGRPKYLVDRGLI